MKFKKPCHTCSRDLRIYLKDFSHQLRTPIAVVYAAIDDLLAGYVLGEEDLMDAKKSLSEILAIVESMETE